MDENAEIDIEALSDEVYIPLNLLPSIIRDLNSRLAALEHEHSAADITSGTLPAARIAEGSLPGSKIEEGTVTLDRFEKSVRDSLSLITLDEDDAGNIWLFLQKPGKPRVRLIFGLASMSKAIYDGAQWNVQWTANGTK